MVGTSAYACLLASLLVTLFDYYPSMSCFPVLNINSDHDVPAVMWYFFNKGDCGIIFIGKLLDNIWQPIHMLPR
ncbi:hypothetical protein D1605_001660 [Xylella fastidiosa subsp. fastidiosa]|uniref:Uncharacterized protein n=1 Tax=Xylella fastidiosa (strain Temecula1 / ATCC 700964) TaxID=183190 RepID=Q87EJ0_XYLFT|nr:hypothetical protein [Xylella fastidiosa]AAO28201.1 conserved hypothetical protein [Xylella fastidiosa Temecula1]KGM21113.1 hypothetical protein JT24_01780 [Xylella fastidiosa]MBE0262579.1 hypothetical protein [Xylella fastidiosa subsp. fastidiosa]MBE0264832.1 hypothetical protein [Xylella fastidiosa subsp. fastidiosa]MBE0267028.1 hypothetical protein [Xylella fastidiosa subsp. fastidiosa]